MKRRFDGLGRIVIPKEMRVEVGIGDGDEAHLEVLDNKIIITKPGSIDYKERINQVLECIENENDETYRKIANILKGE